MVFSTEVSDMPLLLREIQRPSSTLLVLFKVITWLPLRILVFQIHITVSHLIIAWDVLLCHSDLAFNYINRIMILALGYPLH